MTTGQFDRSDYFRSLKISFIKIASMVCTLAIEEGAPYYRAFEALDQQILKTMSLNNTLEVFELLKSTLSGFTRLISLGRMQTYSRPVKQCLDYIAENYKEKITLDVLAEHTGLSTYYISSLLKKETGQSLSDHINTTRVKAAQKMLMRDDANIIDIAEQLGFSSHNHFSNVFKRITKTTPSEYMKNNTPHSSDNNLAPNLTGAGAVLQNANSVLTAMPELFDAAKVIDLNTNTFYALKSDFCEDSEIEFSGSCFDHWGRDAVCENCISREAYINNRIALKLDRSGDETYFVLALPKVFRGEVYIVEMLKKIDKNMFSDGFAPLNEGVAASLFMGQEIFADENQENDDVFYDRKSFEVNFETCLRRCRLSNLPISLIAVRYEGDLAGDNTNFSAANLQIRTILLNQARAEGACLENPCCFAGAYTGSTAILALGGVDEARAAENLAAIKDNVQSLTFNLLKSNEPYQYSFARLTFSEDIPASKVFMTELLAKLDRPQ